MKPAILYLLAASTALLQVPVSADASGRELLERMSAAAQSLNYTGTFVYQRQGLMDIIQIVHFSYEEGELERLFSLTGPK